MTFTSPSHFWQQRPLTGMRCKPRNSFSPSNNTAPGGILLFSPLWTVQPPWNGAMVSPLIEKPWSLGLAPGLYWMLTVHCLCELWYSACCRCLALLSCTVTLMAVAVWPSVPSSSKWEWQVEMGLKMSVLSLVSAHSELLVHRIEHRWCVRKRSKNSRIYQMVHPQSLAGGFKMMAHYN